MQSLAVLVKRNSQASADELNDLVTELVGRFESEAEAALEDLCGKHPAHASALRRRYDLLCQAGVLTPPPPELEVPEKLGEFRLVRMLGGGGMGVVYLAIQEPLGREVALKVVRPEHLYFPGTRERFRREVDTIARLQHPGIVPIYAVGEENGVPYFAMELVRGRSLQNALDDVFGRMAERLAGHDLAPSSNDVDYLFHGTWEQACLRVIRQVAEALEYAHQQGVLHRDIKPSNVMLTSQGTSRAMLLDFGLATASGTTRLTRSGAQLGTLHYMSPEQARGSVDSVSVRSDVYSLGVTLYELLTLRRPFDGGSDVEVALAIQRGHCKRPRELNPALSEEAEIVCLKAIEHEPSRRYTSAADFARDLGNVLDHHPIEARPPSTVSRARKWVRRHPTLSVALALGAVVCVGGPALFAWQQVRAAALVRSQRDRAEANLQQALAAVDRMLTRVGDEDLRFEPRMEKLRATLLQDAVELLQGLLDKQEADPRLRMETAAAHERVGTLSVDLGRVQDAVRAFDKALDLLQREPAEDGKDLSRDRTLARVWFGRTTALGDEDLDAARAEHDRVNANLEGLLAHWPNDPVLLGVVASNDSQLGSFMRDADRRDEAAALMQHALDVQEQVTKQSDDPQLLSQLAEFANEYGLFLLDTSTEGVRDTQAEAWLERAIASFEDALSRAPDDRRITYALATARNNLAGVLRRAGEMQGARELYDLARSELEQLTRDFPDTPNYAYELAIVLNQIGLLEDWPKPNGEAERFYREAYDLFGSLTQRFPESHWVLNHLGTTAMNLAVTMQRRGAARDAKPIIDRALDVQQRAMQLAPDRNYELDFAMHYRAVHNILFDLGDARGAAEAVEQMVRWSPKPWRLRTQAAAGVARCLKWIRENEKLAPDELAKLERDYSERAVVQLRAAIERGMPDPSEMHTVEVLDPLRGTEPFDEFVSSIN